MKLNIYSYWWLIPLTLLFPVVEVIIFLLRGYPFSNELLLSSLYFLPVGLASGYLLIYLLRKQMGNSKYGIFLGIGYFVGAIIAILAMIYGGLYLDPLTNIVFLGIIPVIICTLIGYYARGRA